MIEGLKSEIRKLYKITSLFLTLALQSLNKNQSKIQENVKNGEKITNHKKALGIPRDLNPGPSSSNKHIQHRTECMTPLCQPYSLETRCTNNCSKTDFMLNGEQSKEDLPSGILCNMLELSIRKVLCETSSLQFLYTLFALLRETEVAQPQLTQHALSDIMKYRTASTTEKEKKCRVPATFLAVDEHMERTPRTHSQTHCKINPSSVKTRERRHFKI